MPSYNNIQQNSFKLDLSPKSLSEYISNEKIKKIVAITINACKEMNMVMGHTLITGPRGTGKSLSHSSPIMVNMSLHNQSRIYLTTIGDIFDGFNNSMINKDNFQSILDIPENFKILQLNLDSYKLEWVKPVAIIRHKSPDELIQIETRSGRKVRGTYDHSFLVFKNGNLVPTKGTDVKVGDIFLTVCNIPRIQQITSFEQYDLTPELGYLSGLYLAEGSSYYSISNQDSGILAFTKQCLNKLKIEFGPHKSYNSKKHDIIGIRMTKDLKKPNLLKYFKMFYYDHSKNEQYKKRGASKKTLPDFVFSAPEDYIMSLIAGYFDGDGSFEDKRMKVSSASFELHSRLSLLLSLLGIHNKTSTSKVNYNNYTYYHSEISISRNDMLIFQEKIAPYMHCQHKKQSIMTCEYLEKSSANAVKGLEEIFRRIRFKKSMNFDMWNIYRPSTCMPCGITRNKLKRFINHLEEYERKTSLTEDINLLKKIVNADVVFDTIKSIHRINKESEYVYDFSTPYENFISDGVVVHNTTLATLIAKELGFSYKIISANAIDKLADLNTLFLNNFPKIIIIDEIHNLKPAFSDLMHEAMDNFKYGCVDEDNQIVTISLNPFTLIGITTDEGKLTAPMYSRFSKKYHLMPYTPLNLQKIVMKVSENNKINIDSDAAYEIAVRSSGIPRIAVLYFVNVYEYALKYNKGIITRDIVIACFELHNIDKKGLNDVQHEILKILNNSKKPMGVDNLAQRTGIGVEALTKIYEPPLLSIGFIKRSSTGREITNIGRAHISRKN